MKSEYLTKWEYPSDYGGFSPDGDYLIYSRNRDSSILENCNYEMILEQLTKLSDTLVTDEEEPFAYDFRAGHWACGWVEYILISANSPDQLITEAEEIVCALADYPVLNESVYSDKQTEAVYEYWLQCSLSDRIDACKSYGLSIFAARSDDLFNIADEFYYWIQESAEIY